MRNEIIREADHLMRVGGYEALNFGTIASKLKTTRANLHYHFNNKENLAVEVTDQYTMTVQARFEHLSKIYPTDFPSILIAMENDLWHNLSVLEYQGYCICTRLLVDFAIAPEPLRHKAEEHFAWLVDAFAREIRISQAAGMMTAHRSADDLARDALSIYLGVAQMAMSLAEERRPGSYSRRRIKEWLATVR